MNNTLPKLALAGASIVLGWAAITPAQAAILTYDIGVTVDSGPLLGQTYTGSFSFDDSNLNGLVPVSDLTFSFQGVNYTEADDPAAGVEFLNGNLLGLSFSTDAAFSFVPGFSDVSEASFTYDIAAGAGAGDVDYTLRQPPTGVPEPSLGLSLLALGMYGTLSRLKRK